jgi:hypothetical protein
MMARLRLCSSPEETDRRRPLTESEIIELSIVAQSIAAITEVMQEYACVIRGDKAQDALANCMGVFNVLEWLIQPVADYLNEYAGEEAKPEEPEQTA